MENTRKASTSTQDWPWMNTSLSPDERAALLLAQMTLEEKVDHAQRDRAVQDCHRSRLGIPRYIMADGPAGIRIDRNRRDVNEGKATSPPAPIALAATWDLAAAAAVRRPAGSGGVGYGTQCLIWSRAGHRPHPATSVACSRRLGRTPSTGQMAARYIQGVQRHPVIATAKHYNVNAQEDNRLEVDAQLDERTLQEIYTLPFAAAVTRWSCRRGHGRV